ncbi:MAG TPA: ABC transporter substrate-binding protein, partial [Candidatus Limnocylindrales bacterium]
GGLLGTATRLSQLSVSPFATLPALEAAFQAGTVQLATGISPTAITELQRLGLHDETAAAPGRSYEAIVFNLGSDACASVAAAAAGRGSGCPTADLAIRRAIDLVAARPDLVAALNRRSDRFVIEAVPSAVAPASWFFADVPTPAVDPDGARAALDAAGWRDTDGDGIREREGVEARLALCAPDDPDSAAAARLLADEVRAVGIEASLGSGSCDLTTGAFDLALATRSYAVDPADLRLRFHSQAIPPSGDNIGRVAFADIDADLQRAATSVDFAVVKDAMVSFQQAYLDHVVEIPIGAVADVELVGPAMGNYFQSWVSPGWNAQDWFVRR